MEISKDRFRAFLLSRPEIFMNNVILFLGEGHNTIIPVLKKRSLVSPIMPGKLSITASSYPHESRWPIPECNRFFVADGNFRRISRSEFLL